MRGYGLEAFIPHGVGFSIMRWNTLRTQQLASRRNERETAMYFMTGLKYHVMSLAQYSTPQKQVTRFSLHSKRKETASAF